MKKSCSVCGQLFEQDEHKYISCEAHSFGETEFMAKGSLEETKVYLDKEGYSSLGKLLEPLVDDTMHTDYIEDIKCANCETVLVYFDEKKQTSVTLGGDGMFWLENKDQSVKKIFFCSRDCFDQFFCIKPKEHGHTLGAVIECKKCEKFHVNTILQHE